MNKLLTKIVGVALGATMAIGVGVGLAVGSVNNDVAQVRAQDDTITFSTLGLTSGTAYNDPFISADGNFSVTFPKGGNNGKYYSTGNAIRSYSGDTFIVESKKASNLSSITLTFGSGDGSNAITTDVSTWTSPSWTGDASSVTFSVGGSSGHRRIASVQATLASSSKTPLTQPVLSRNGNVISWSFDENADHYEIQVNGGAWANTDSNNQHTLSLEDSMFYDIGVKAIAKANDNDHSNSAVGELSFDTLLHKGTADDPYCVADARAVIDKSEDLTDKYATGIVSKIVTAYSSQYGNVTFDFSDDGTTESNQLQAYRCKGTYAATVAVGDIVIVEGDLTKYGSTYEFGQNCEVNTCTKQDSHHVTISTNDISLSIDEIGESGQITLTTAEKKKGVITNVTNAKHELSGNILSLTEIEGDVVITANVVDAAITSLSLSGYQTKFALGDDFSSDGLVVKGIYDDWLSSGHTEETLSSGFTIDSSLVDMNAEGSYTVKVKYGNIQETYTIYVSEIFDNTKGEYHVLSANNLKVKDHIVIGAKDGSSGKSYSGSEMIMSSLGSNNVSADTTTITNKNILSSKDNILDLELVEGSVANSFALKVDDGVYLKGGFTSNNLKTGSEIDNTTSFVFTYSNGAWSIVCQADSGRNVMQYNPNTSNNSPLFACYASATQTAVKVYKFVSYQSEALEYSQRFLTANNDPTEHTCEDTIIVWDDLKSEFEKITEGAQSIFAEATHAAPETYVNPEEYSVAHCVARYDDAVRKHVDLQTESNEFMGRFGEGKINPSFSTMTKIIPNKSHNSVIVIVVVSTISLSAVGGYFLLRKKKEEK